MSVVDALPVDAVIESSSDCSDRARADAALASALSAARGPRVGPAGTDRSWRLVMSVRSTAPGTRSAEAQIADDTGRVDAERTVNDRTSGSCLALARAVGAWAQIVLDEELARTPANPEARAERAETVSAPRPRAETSIARPPDADAPALSLRPTGAVRSVEAGTMLFLRNGVAATGGIFGASPFVAVGFGESWVVRPAILVGTSTSRVPPDASRSANVTAVGGRLDVCRRWPGNYIDRRGIELDACAGGDVVYVASALESAVRGSLGPSAIIRGELGANLALEIRGLVGANLARSGLGPDAPFFVAAAELGGSVRFR